MQDYQKAESFLQDALKVYVQESWSMLADDIRVKLADCQKHMDAKEKYLRTCVHLSASRSLHEDKKKFYHNEMIGVCQELKGSPVYIPTKPIMLIPQIQPNNPSFLVTDTSLVTISIHLAMQEPVCCDNITASLSFRADDTIIHTIPDHVDGGAIRKHKRNPSGGSFASIGSMTSGNSIDVINAPQGTSKFPQMLSLAEHYEYTANRKTVMSCSLKSKMSLRRMDSGNKVAVEKEVEKGDHSLCLKSGEVTLTPGESKVTLSGKLNESGLYSVTQLCLQIGGAEFLRNIPVEEVSFFIISEKPQVKITAQQEPLYAGIDQPLLLTVSPGSHGIQECTQLHITHTNELIVHAKEMKNNCIELPALPGGDTKEVIIYVRAGLKADCTTQWNYQLKVEWEGPGLSHDQLLSFQQPIRIHHTLHTATTRKFVQCLVQSSCELSFNLTSPSLSCDSNDVELLSLNKTDRTLVVNNIQNASYMWELKSNIPELDSVLQFHFNVKYGQSSQKQDAGDGAEQSDHVKGSADCDYHFTLENFQTLYTVKSSVPLPGDQKQYYLTKKYDFTFIVKSLKDSENLVYNLICDKDTWNMEGQRQGLVKFTDGSFSHTLQISALSEGYLGHPHIQLYKPKKGWSNAIESNTTQNIPLDIEDLQSQGILLTLGTGRVYYTSLASRVHIRPGCKDTNLETCSSSKSDGKTSLGSHTSSKLELVDSGPL